ncbi:hypothetical protein EVAR_30939_1 [Eumeta japonica]|uniref:Uncharacterized protein n=1 Tax=Eumeta variegata TaxID=151549 RepID=A0A4C1V450_EUMVA|nr:hypothetical protein EVAR_30939_1 [Eumeta japonica]
MDTLEILCDARGTAAVARRRLAHRSARVGVFDSSPPYLGSESACLLCLACGLDMSTRRQRVQAAPAPTSI